MAVKDSADDIAGLSERLRKTLAGVEPDDFRGDNLAIFIASELEPSIEDETLDDSLTWKQGAVDACDRVLDAIHAHYATAIDALQADLQVKEQAIADLGRAIHKWQSERDALQARVKELEAECSAYASQNTNLRNDLVLVGMARDSAEQERDEAYEWAAKIIDAECELILSKQTPTNDPLSMEDAVNQNLRLIAFILPDLAAAIRRLAGPEKEGKE